VKSKEANAPRSPDLDLVAPPLAAGLVGDGRDYGEPGRWRLGEGQINLDLIAGDAGFLGEVGLHRVA
jgi:hypothetical protein